MDVEDAVAVARGLLAEHGLTGWSVVLDRAKTRAGVCRADRREIGLSAPLTALHSPEEVRDTILHEIAHALVGPQPRSRRGVAGDGPTHRLLGPAAVLRAPARRSLVGDLPRGARRDPSPAAEPGGGVREVRGGVSTRPTCCAGATAAARSR